MVEFKEWVRTQRHPIVMYTDSEALLQKIQKYKGENTLVFQKHILMSYALYVKASNNVSVDRIEQHKIESNTDFGSKL